MENDNECNNEDCEKIHPECKIERESAIKLIKSKLSTKQEHEHPKATDYGAVERAGEKRERHIC